MTTAAASMPLHSAKLRRRSPLSKWLGRNVWALNDQILISAANFITMVLAARAMSKASFGAFTVVYAALLLANVLQSTLVTQAHNVIAATKSGYSYCVYTSTTAVGQIAMVVIEALAAIIAALWAWRTHSEYLPLLVALIPAIVGWQLQEFVRRVLYTEGRIGAAFANDLISYAGQTVWVIVLWSMQALTGSSALYALAWTSLAAAVFGIWQLRNSINLEFDASVLLENWHFGKWLAGAELVGWMSSLNMYVWLAAKIINTSAAGDLKAAQLVFGPTRMLAFFLGNILPIQFARELARGGDAEMDSAYRKTVAVVVPLLGLYCLLAALFA
ncbi:MAG: oligosaccharide flippase family protein, partial [Phycisphaerae bacterium]|nr:oligosaccharide flippase family protein [Phycisphaerae bacterium]